MIKIDPFRDVELLKAIDGRVIKRLHALYAISIKKWYKRGIRGRQREITDYPGTAKEFYANCEAFGSELERKLIGLIGKFVSKQTIDQLLAKEVEHFHAIPEKYIKRQEALDDVIKEGLAGLLESVDAYEKKYVSPAIEEAKRQYARQPQKDYIGSTYLDYYWSLLNETKEMIKSFKKVSRELLAGELKEEEVLERKLAGYDATTLARNLAGLKTRDKVYFITTAGGVVMGQVITVKGFFGKKLYYVPSTSSLDTTFLTEYDTERMDAQSIGVRNIFFLEKVN